MLEKLAERMTKLSPMRVILSGYLVIILAGTLLLLLPQATRQGEITGILDALFTATSATCVTGLIRFDTYTHWTLFGQLVILVMIQIGGIGFMTVALWFISLTRARIGLAPRVVMQSSISAPQMGGIVHMTRFVILGTAIVEGCGAVLLSFFFCPRMGIVRGIWYALFHSVSAFCNAGFDLMGVLEPFSSLTAFSGSWYFNLVIMLLVIIGGLGFFVWRDLLSKRFRFSRLRLHTKLVLTVSVLLTFGGALVIFLFEQNGTLFADMPLSQQILGCLFQSVTTRTAGFNTLDLSQLTPSSQFLMVCMMLVGGSPGSTAGGMKTTTLAVLLLSIAATCRRRKHTEVYGRRLQEGTTRMANTVFMTYLLLALGVSMVISNLEGVDFMTALFEGVSAMGTVGLSLSLTPTLGAVSETLLIILMFIGRVGSITFLLAFASGKGAVASTLPQEEIQIG